MRKVVDTYTLEKISSRMGKIFGKIPKGDEELYTFILHPMESNLIKVHRDKPDTNGRHAKDAIHMSLLKIDGYINGIDYDFTKFLNLEIKAFLDALLKSFDPFTNPELFTVVKTTYHLDNKDDLKEYFELPVKCLLRIEKSIDIWSELGQNGYFTFIEEQMGHLIEHDRKMNFAYMLKNSDMKKLGIDPSNLKSLEP